MIGHLKDKYGRLMMVGPDDDFIFIFYKNFGPIYFRLVDSIPDYAYKTLLNPSRVIHSHQGSTHTSGKSGGVKYEIRGIFGNYETWIAHKGDIYYSMLAGKSKTQKDALNKFFAYLDAVQK